MKKSKILIPAMALLLFSTAASITGTVAWFTSTRVFEMTAGQFEIAQLDGNLDVEVKAGIGTELGTASTDKTVKLASTTRLLDTSVDLDGKAWRLNNEGGTDKYTGLSMYNAQTPNWLVKTLGTKNYYAAVSWEMKITYDFASEKGAMGIYLDLSKSQFDTPTAADPAGGDGTKGSSELGFRIMFIGGGTSTPTVWGNHKPVNAPAWESKTYSAGSYVVYDKKIYYSANAITEAEGTFNSGDNWVAKPYDVAFGSTYDGPYLQHVNSATTTLPYAESVETGSNKSKGTYVTSKTASGTGSYVRYVDGEDNGSNGAGSTYKAERIATIAKPSGTETSNSATVTCIAWFEGTDPNIVNGTAMKSLGATINIYARCDSVSD